MVSLSLTSSPESGSAGRARAPFPFFKGTAMRTVFVLLFGGLVAYQTAHLLMSVQQPLLGRWESADGAGLFCEFTEKHTVRISGDFGQVVGTYTAEKGGASRI